jgi:Toprim domain/CHC2 zinc finger
MIDADQLWQARTSDIVATARGFGVSLKRVSASELAGACPRCGGRDRVNIQKRLWSCRGCSAGGDVIALARHVRGCGFPEAVARLADEDTTPEPTRKAAAKFVASYEFEPAASPATDNGDKRKKALALWVEGVDPRRTVAERYLNSRALALDDDGAGDVIRWHPRIGALVALFRNVLTGEPQAVCRTFLDAQARKIGRKFLGTVWGAVIMLNAFDEVLEGLQVGEGVETCMAARQLGLRPCWAVGSAGAVAASPVLAGIEALTLLQETDEPSERACEACAARWHTAGREVFINQPTAGKDLNGAIRGSS